MAAAPSSGDLQVYRMPRWVPPALLAFALACAAGAYLLFVHLGDRWWAIALAAVALIALAGGADALTTRLVLGPDGVTMVSNFRRRQVPRSEIVDVAVEKGAPAALALRSGGWVHLPATAGPHLNTLRAWLRRTAR